jgi:hypothetical protein
VHPAQVHRALAAFDGIGRFQIVVEHPQGQRYDRALLRLGMTSTPADAPAFAERVAAQVKANVLIGMEVEIVDEASLPEGAAPPRFTDVMVDRRTKS